MKIKLSVILLLLMGACVSVSAQQKQGDRWVDNNLTFKIISERVQQRGMMKVCIADTSNECIQNLISGFVVRIFDDNNQQLWAGKSAGREEMIRFPAAMPKAKYLVLKAFKPYVLNRATGTRIHQDEPMELKYYFDE